MPKFPHGRSPQESAQAGLRILARIIAREVSKDQLGMMGSLSPDISLANVTASKFGPRSGFAGSMVRPMDLNADLERAVEESMKK